MVGDYYEPTQHHFLLKPFNNKYPFIVSSYGQDELTSRYRVYSIGSFIVFFLSGALAITMTLINLGN